MAGRCVGTMIVTGSGRGIGAAVALPAERATSVSSSTMHEMQTLLRASQVRSPNLFGNLRSGRAPAMLPANCRWREGKICALSAWICANGGRAIAVQGDVSREDDVRHLFEAVDREFGSLSVLVNNAGITGGFARVDEVSPDVLSQVFAGISVCSEAIRRLSIRHGGRGGSTMTAPGRYCCKSRKTPGDNFPAGRRSEPRSLINVVSGSLPKSPVSLSLGDEVPHIFTRRSRLQPGEFLINGAKRLLQHNRHIASH